MSICGEFAVAGGDSKELPVRKCPGVKHSRSSMLSVRGSRGLEFRHASISVNNVVYSSNVSR